VNSKAPRCLNVNSHSCN